MSDDNSLDDNTDDIKNEEAVGGFNDIETNRLPPSLHIKQEAVDTLDTEDYESQVHGLGTPVFEDVETKDCPMAGVEEFVSIRDIKQESITDDDERMSDGQTEAGSESQLWTEPGQIKEVSVKDEPLQEALWGNNEDSESSDEPPPSIRNSRNTCKTCGKYFTREAALERHLLLHPAEEKPRKCDIRGEGVPSPRNLRTYSSVHPVINREPRCEEEGGKEFDKKEHLKIHLANHTGEKPYACTVRGDAFHSPESLKLHSDSHTDQQLTCDMCGKSFPSSGSLAHHSLMHTGYHFYRCDICDQLFATLSTFKDHVASHSGEDPFKCQTCGKEFRASNRFKRHLRTHSSEKSFECSTCGKVFVSPYYLKVHGRSHSTEKRYDCETCGKSFKTKRTLANHQTIHTGGKSCSCDVCGEIFPSDWRLKKHAVVHTGIKPFQCELCGKHFLINSCLKNHLISHTDERPYKCSICEEDFRSSYLLKRHSLIHASEKSV